MLNMLLTKTDTELVLNVPNDIDEIEVILECRKCGSKYSLATTTKGIEHWLHGYPQEVLGPNDNDDILNILAAGLCKSCKVESTSVTS